MPAPFSLFRKLGKSDTIPPEVLAARGVAVVLGEARAGQRAPGPPQSDGPDCQGRHRLPT